MTLFDPSGMIGRIDMRLIRTAALLTCLATPLGYRIEHAGAARDTLRLPHHFTESQTRYFLSQHADWPGVAGYLSDPGSIPWGIVVDDYERSFLIFIDARKATHVVELTGSRIVAEVRRIRYQSPEIEVVGLP